jgi:valyl-tRNA synthetase
MQGKTLVADLPKTYNPAEVEDRTYAFWEERGYFSPDPRSDSESFVITIPPPNVTGELHLGHALTYSIEDVMGRYKRMRGYNTLILPGTDHAGIATQNAVERQLAKEGLTRYDLGRERFLERVQAWVEQYRATIRRQFRALGEGYDWTRERFTMDPAYYRAVIEMFVRLYNEGYIYRGSRVINWCPRCRTGISDIEVRAEEHEDTLYYVRYPFTDGTDAIVVATVRPETMLGDVAVAVHPEDARYVGAVGKTVILPLTGKPLPVIADSFVDREFGTGAVKITPAHDYADFEVGERHALPMPVVITPEGRMASDTPPPFPGMTVAEARAEAVKQLEEGGYIVWREPYVHNVPVCDRCESIIEPLLSEQWFMRMKELAQPAIDVVKAGKVRFVPERWTRIYLEWMENIRDWNISRQLWWGHRIPIYYCANGHVVAARFQPEACQECGSQEFTQDPDVLDTWFSSALWPFATLGWPEQTEDLVRFYPTSFMNTSSQILYLWIARMIMMGLHFMGDIPFPIVLINPTILNEHGQRMSKSLGTGIDPLEVVEQYGADATRFGLFSAGSIMQQEIRIAGYQRAEEGRNFANKIWNAARFVLMNLQEAQQAVISAPSFEIEDRWILSRINTVTAEVTEALEMFDLTLALRLAHGFFWREFADWYIESAKRRLYSEDKEAKVVAQGVLWSVLERSMRLLHPFMPFITEEIWQHLRRHAPPLGRELSAWSRELPESIMIAPWPSVGPTDIEAERVVALAMDIVRAVRNLRTEYNVPPRKRLHAEIVAGERRSALLQAAPMIASLAGLAALEVVATTDSTVQGQVGPAVSLLVDEVSISIPLGELTDIEEERKRLRREIEQLEAEGERARKLLANPNFTTRAPTQVVEAERIRAERSASGLARLRERLRQLEGESP